MQFTFFQSAPKTDPRHHTIFQDNPELIKLQPLFIALKNKVDALLHAAESKGENSLDYAKYKIVNPLDIFLGDLIQRLHNKRLGNEVKRPIERVILFTKTISQVIDVIFSDRDAGHFTTLLKHRSKYPSLYPAFDGSCYLPSSLWLILQIACNADLIHATLCIQDNQEVDISDYYSLLNLSNNASAQEIINNYSAVREDFEKSQSHSAEELQNFVKISKAYCILSDNENKLIYDKLLLEKSDQRPTKIACH